MLHGDDDHFFLIAPRDTDNSNEEAVPAACHYFPVDPRNDLALLFVKNVTLECPYKEPLTRVLPLTGKVILSFARVHQYDYTCWYQFFHRHPKDENYNAYGEWRPFPSLGIVTMTAENNFMKVTCSDFWGFTVYQNTHVFIPIFPSEHTSSPSKPNVLILLVESLSQHVFKRLMPKTQQQIELMGGQYFDYFVKTHENSFPNSFALLTGEPSYPLDEDSGEDVNLNDYEYLWNVFKRNGYTTGFVEDLTKNGIFDFAHLFKQGFQQQPTDFYPHAFWNEMYPSWTDFNSIDNHMTFNKDFCFATNGPKINILLEQVTRFVEQNHRHPFFLFASACQLTHEYLNYVSLLDDPVSEALAKLHHMDNNTIIVLAGDHGYRRGFSSSNSIGRLEENMSLMSVIVPDAIHVLYPHLRQMMSSNQHHLVSYRDFNLMMKNIASGEYQTPVATDQPSNASAPMDPSREVVPGNRSCSDAGIEEKYCVCGNYVSFNLNGISRGLLDDLQGLNDDVRKLDSLIESYISRKCDPSFVPRSTHFCLPTGNVSVLNEHVIVHLVNPGGENLRLNMYRTWEKGSPTRWLLSRNPKCRP